MKQTVKFKFRKSGFNAHYSEGEFQYDTAERALDVYHLLSNTPGFFDVELI